MKTSLTDKLVIVTLLVVLSAVGWIALRFVLVSPDSGGRTIARQSAHQADVKSDDNLVSTDSMETISRRVDTATQDLSTTPSPFALVIGDDKPELLDDSDNVVDAVVNNAWLPASGSSGTANATPTVSPSENSQKTTTQPIETEGLITEDLLNIGGKIVSVDGEPVPAHGIFIKSNTAAADNYRTVKTDSYGRFLVDGLNRGEYLLTTQKHPFFGSSTLRTSAGDNTVTIKLPLLDVARITGRVTDTLGQPLIGARVIPPYVDEKTRTNDEGMFSTRITATAGQGILLRFEARGYLSANKYVSGKDWSPDEPIEIDMKLRQGNFDLAGFVFDQQGYPVRSALVQITSRESKLHLSTQTDKNGRFELEQVLPARDYEMKVSSTSRYTAYVAEQLTLASGMGDIHLTLEYAPIGTMTGSIVDPSGLPIPELSLLVISEGEAGRATTISSNESGEYKLVNFVAGGLNMRSRVAPGIYMEGIQLEPGIEMNQDLVVDMGDLELFGTVSDSDGVPVSDAEVQMNFSLLDESGYKSSTIRSAVSDAEGVFQFTGLGPGGRELKISAEGHSKVNLNIDPMLNPGPHLITLMR